MLVDRRGASAREWSAAASLRWGQELFHVGIEVTSRVAAAPICFSAGKYAPTAVVAHRSLSHCNRALFVPSSYWAKRPRFVMWFYFVLFLLCVAIAVLVMNRII